MVAITERLKQLLLGPTFGTVDLTELQYDLEAEEFVKRREQCHDIMMQMAGNHEATVCALEGLTDGVIPCDRLSDMEKLIMGYSTRFYKHQGILEINVGRNAPTDDEIMYVLATDALIAHAAKDGEWLRQQTPDGSKLAYTAPNH